LNDVLSHALLEPLPASSVTTKVTVMSPSGREGTSRVVLRLKTAFSTSSRGWAGTAREREAISWTGGFSAILVGRFLWRRSSPGVRPQGFRASFFALPEVQSPLLTLAGWAVNLVELPLGLRWVETPRKGREHSLRVLWGGGGGLKP
jgi:hypothetical protein